MAGKHQLELHYGRTYDIPGTLADSFQMVLQRITSNAALHTHLIVSPYLTKPHQLDLRALDVTCQLVAHVLAALRPLKPTYATEPYSEAFNWSEVFITRLSGLVNKRKESYDLDWPIGSIKSFYVVHFQSQLNSDVDLGRLALLDQKSHEEAMASGGLLKYWFGERDSKRRNLATCIWRSEEDAVKGGKGPWHRQARQAAAATYEKITFTRLWLQLRRDEEGINWLFEETKR